MNRENRLSKLEAAVRRAETPAPWHHIIADIKEEAAAKQAAMIAAGMAKETDNFIQRIIIDPPWRTHEEAGEFLSRVYPNCGQRIVSGRRCAMMAPLS